MTKNVKFDLNSRFLALYGHQIVNILNLSNKQITKYNIDKTLFSQILELQLASSDENEFKCEIACKGLNFNKVVIFDVSKDIDFKR